MFSWKQLDSRNILYIFLYIFFSFAELRGAVCGYFKLLFVHGRRPYCLSLVLRACRGDAVGSGKFDFERNVFPLRDYATCIYRIIFLFENNWNKIYLTFDVWENKKEFRLMWHSSFNAWKRVETIKNFRDFNLVCQVIYHSCFPKSQR